jgi:toxin HigB-1
MKIEFHRSFKKKYKKAPVKIRHQFNERLFLFKKDVFNPRLNNHPLSGNRGGQWTINVTGDWRATYIFQDKEAVIFIDLDTHGNLYK